MQLYILILCVLPCIVSGGNSSTTGKTFGTVPPFELCDDHADCMSVVPEGAKCEFVCICQDGHVEVRNDETLELEQCAPIQSKIGGSCLDNLQCQTGKPGKFSWCSGSIENLTCQCIHGAVADADICYTMANNLGSSCENSIQCQHMSASCLWERCSCKATQVEDLEKNKCYDIKDSIGDVCEIDEQCKRGKPGPLSSCLQVEGQPEDCKRCQCKDSVSNENQTICYSRQDLIGGLCIISEQCPENSECQSGTCSCKSEYTSNPANNTCLDIQKKVGDPCQISEQCTKGSLKEHSYCALPESEKIGTCQCCKDSVYDDRVGLEQCLLKASAVGDKCVIKEQCEANLGNQAICKEDTCQCPSESSVELDKRCHSKVTAIGEECEDTIQCFGEVFNGFANCTKTHPEDEAKTCQCNLCSVDYNSKKCLKKAEQIGEACDQDVQCTADLGESKCSQNNTCECIKGKSVPNVDKTRCLKTIQDFTTTCEVDEQCTNGSPGNNSHCQPIPHLNITVCNCTEKAVHDNKTCYLVAENLGDPCELEAQCKHFLGEFSTCNKNEGKVGVCGCQNISIPSIGNKKCLKIMEQVGDNCEEPKQCQLGESGESLCKPLEEKSDLVCQCSSDAIQIGKKCLTRAHKLGDKCSKHEQCSSALGNQTECLDGICACIKGNVPVPGTPPDTNPCQLGKLIGEKCFEGAWECLGNQTNVLCSKTHSCVCKDNTFVPSNSRDDCLEIVNEINKPCVETQQCTYGEPGELSACISNVCNCTEAGVTDGDGNKCLKKANKVGDECTVDIQCMQNLEESRCDGKECKCVRDSVEVLNGTKCLKKADIGEKCVDTNQCKDIGEAECTGEVGIQVCQCRDTAVEIEKKCLKLAEKLGESCEGHPNQCQNLNNSNCLENVCACEKNFVPTSSGKACLEKVEALNVTCQEPVQCIANGTTCLGNSDADKTCQCIPDEYVELDNRCLMIQTKLNGTCEESIQCNSGIGSNTKCDKETESCICENNFFPINGNCYAKVILGKECQHDEQCILGTNSNAWCNTTDQCGCRAPAFERENNCWRQLVIGDECSETRECKMTIIGATVCNPSTQKCVCEKDFSPDKNGYSCKSLANARVVLSKFLFLIIGLFYVGFGTI